MCAVLTHPTPDLPTYISHRARVLPAPLCPDNKNPILFAVHTFPLGACVFCHATHTHHPNPEAWFTRLAPTAVWERFVTLPTVSDAGKKEKVENVEKQKETDGKKDG